ncbi:MAG: hypothetical protein U9O85_11030 [Euryarchaeota archaeon]|nr:hypothetical protein [Euryarchaeota archaeon]
MDKDEIIKQLKRENEMLKVRIGELEAQLAKYQREVVATDPDCPKEGIFGNNTIAQAAVRIGYKSCHDT